MKKLLTPVLALGTLILAGCAGNELTGGTTPGTGGGGGASDQPAAVMEQGDTYLAQAVMSMNMLAPNTNAATALKMRKAAPDPTLLDTVADQVLAGIEGVAALVNFNPQTIVETVSDREGYEKLYTITVDSYGGTAETYSLYFNERTVVETDDDETETITYMTGIAIMDGVEFTLEGERSEEVEGLETETETELRIYRDRQNYVEISQEFEDNENEYEYKLVENGMEVRSEEYEFETDRNGNLVISLERESAGQEYEIKIHSSDAGITRVEFEIELPNVDDIEGTVTIGVDELGNTVYTLRFDGSDKVYTKTVGAAA